jgi:4-amino-4-deoxy-L-arabinose transferase-like glycosyltransferase
LKKNLAIVLLVSLTINLLYLFLYGQYNPITSDQADYHRIALDILQGKGYSYSSMRCMLYPAFLSSIYALVGIKPIAVFLVQIGMSMLNMLMAYRLAQRFFNQQVAYLTAWLLCFNLPSVAANCMLLTENLFVFTLLCSVSFFSYTLINNKKVVEQIPQSTKSVYYLPHLYCCLAAFFFALATLTREMVVYLIPPMLLVALYYNRHAWQKTLLYAALFLSMYATVLSPWVLRNYAVHGHFVLGTTRGGLVLYDGANPVDGYKYGFDVQDSITHYANTHIANEADRSNYLAQKTKQQLLAQPSRIPYLIALKTVYFFWLFDYELVGFKILNVSYITWILFWAIGCYFIYQNRKNIAHKQGVLLLLGLVFFNLGICWLTYGSPRFRYVTEIYMIIVAAYGLNQSVLFFQKKQTASNL